MYGPPTMMMTNDVTMSIFRSGCRRAYRTPSTNSSTADVSVPRLAGGRFGSRNVTINDSVMTTVVVRYTPVVPNASNEIMIPARAGAMTRVALKLS